MGWEPFFLQTSPHQLHIPLFLTNRPFQPGPRPLWLRFGNSNSWATRQKNYNSLKKKDKTEGSQSDLFPPKYAFSKIKVQSPSLQLLTRKGEVPTQKGSWWDINLYRRMRPGICEPGRFRTKGLLLGDHELLPLWLQGRCMVHNTHPANTTPWTKAPSFFFRCKLLKSECLQRDAVWRTNPDRRAEVTTRGEGAAEASFRDTVET